MTRPRLPDYVRALLLSETAWRLLPTPAAYYLNRERVRDPMQPPALPDRDWTRRERHNLLSTGEERLRNIEGKGPGLATVSAVVVGAVLLAITGGWDDSTGFGRALLVLAAVYGALSLVMPIYLVGPLQRDAVHVAELEEAARSISPEERLAETAARAAMQNDLRNLRLSNLLDAARRELSYSLALLLLWVFLVPVTGLLREEARHSAGANPVGAHPPVMHR